MALRLQFKGIRCFTDLQEAPIRPLTVLVGENSSGKSTFLALCQIASSIIDGYSSEVPFNEPPFLLGAYDQIASYGGGRAGRARSFSVTACLDEGQRRGSIQADFISVNGQPSLSSWRLSVDDLLWQVTLKANRQPVSLIVKSPLGKRETENMQDLAILLNLGLSQHHQPPLEYWDRMLSFKGLDKILADSARTSLGKMLASIRNAFGRGMYAFAPIRTSPQRTYDPISAESKPEGSHVPMLLDQLSRSGSNGQWGSLRSALKEFGTSSGLFEQIEVIKKGNKESDPFQIGVKSGGPTFNLVDVGYGVSQALPILVDTLQRSRKGEVFLLQQPEVHLHPRAQAELGSFFARQVSSGNRFVIETHSDSLVDRIRMEIRRGAIGLDDVSLLYFERRARGAKIYNIALEKDGSVANPPRGYRQFFLDEERTLLET